MVTKMADELDRVRISAAELRVEASSFVTQKGNLKEVEENTSKKQLQREVRRPDLQRYQPGAGQSRRRKDSAEGEARALSSERAHTSGERVSDPDIKMPDSSPSSDLNLLSGDCPSGTSNFNTDRTKDSSNHLHAGRSPVKDKISRTGTSGSPKLSRKIRKPDREIYQPGGRRSKGGRGSGLNKELEQLSKEKEEKTTAGSCGCVGLVEEGKDMLEEDVKEREEKEKVKKSKEGRRKQEPGKEQKSSDSPSTHNGLTSVENVTDKVTNLNISSPATLESQGKKGARAEDGGDRRKKLSSEGRRNRAGGAERGSCDVDGKKKERGTQRSRGGRERGSNHASGRREEGEGVEKSSATHQWEKNYDQTTEERWQRDVQAKDVGQDQNLQGKHRNNHTKDRNGERHRLSEESGNNKVSSASKRYSKSDIRRPRNRTYSTSSASSGASIDAPRGSQRRKANAAFGGRERGEGRLAPRSHEMMMALKEGTTEKQPRQKRWTAREMSSTDSLEEGEVWERDDERRGLRDREAEDDSSAFIASKRNNRGLRGSLGSGRGGILRVSLDKQSSSSTGAGEDQTKRKNQGPRGRGRGILVLPAHTELTASPEPGPRLMGGMRGGMGLARGRGGRGGSTRRLWDPNNPDKKPALAGNQQSQRSPLQQSLYLQHQGGYGPLHFLDTDDETAGSPPIPQGDHFQSQQAAAMAYYKFQNSDNPYCYPLPANAPNTPPRYAYPYQFSYQMSASNGIYPSPALAPFYGTYGQGGQGYPITGGTTISQEEAEVQTRGELGKLLRVADSQELQLSNLLSRERLSPDGLDRMAQLRAELLTLYERVILTDIEFSDSQNLDQVLWKNVFYQVIERFRQLLKDQDSDTAVQIRAMLLTILEEGAVFFDSLLQKLQTVFQFKLEDYMDGMAVRSRPLRKTVKYALISAQRCMICQGDIARYREQASDSANYGKARSWYLKAQQIAPKNGRPYNQLALLAVYTKRKLDAVYYYMRSLAASNPILTAKESLMSLFEEAKRKAEQIERRRKQDLEAGTRGLRGRGGGRGEDATRVEIWIRPSGHPGVASRSAGSESSKEPEQDAGLSALTASDLNKRFILSFLHTHGKLFTKVGMESFPAVASHVLREFRALLRHSPSPLGTARMLQIVTINMFTIHYAQTRAGGQGETRSVLEEQATSLGLAMFGLLVQRCTEILKETPAELIPAEELGDCDAEEEEPMVRVSMFPTDLRELLPSVKVWSDWMLGHPEQWNPPPCSVDGSPDVWQFLAELCNALACVYHGETPLYKADADSQGEEDMRLLVLEEDRMLAGFIPLLAAPQEPCYIDPQTDAAMAADCKRVTVLKYFLEALCGQEEPLLAFKGGKYISVAAPPAPSQQREGKSQSQTPEQSQEDDVILEDSSLSASEGEVDGDVSEDDIRELRARRHALAHKLAQQQKRRDKIQAVLQTGGQLELEIRPFYLVPDTNCFIDHLDGLRKLLACGTYILVVPLIVITELDGLAKGLECRDGEPAAHARLVQEQAKAAVAFLEKGFEAREPGLRALTSRGSQLESIAFRSEDTSGQKGNNDDVILSCCLHYCQDKAKDFMPVQRDRPVRLRREVVLLTDDRNLRVKALTKNVPVRDIPAFLSWAKVG
ncbi:telomerase-binding protein EST1A isoform X2 [Electrophorus electricus]|uniref:telomerase-binding protein EST1A isoform X2 n=1 Tax=Electrophorus electricus TaxID=8005 RepID=UPI0015CFD07F|nr:telomerase-binding protein EST1A isoform X2 [Electrophorus electricus]